MLGAVMTLAPSAAPERAMAVYGSSAPPPSSSPFPWRWLALGGLAGVALAVAKNRRLW